MKPMTPAMPALLERHLPESSEGFIDPDEPYLRVVMKLQGLDQAQAGLLESLLAQQAERFHQQAVLSGMHAGLQGS
jgi:hypothetical protein